jgi:hypothetical protein
MHRSRAAIAALVALATIACCAPASAVIVRDNRNPSTQGDVWEPDAGFVVDINVLLVKNRTVVFSTRNLSGSGDPILHLLPPGASANGPVKQVAMDDDSGGNLNARLRFTPTQTGAHRLILRATRGQGTCELRQDERMLFGSVRGSSRPERWRPMRIPIATVAVNSPPRTGFPWKDQRSAHRPSRASEAGCSSSM